MLKFKFYTKNARMTAMHERLVADQNLKDSIDKAQKVTARANKILDELRTTSRDFYLKLSLLSGGIVSLSITFMGYLVSIPNHKLVYPELLFVGWFLLIVAVIGGVYRNFFYDRFGHYQVQWQRINSLLEMKRSELEMVRNFPDSFANINSSEISKHITTYENEIKKIAAANKSNRRNEKINEHLWIWMERCSNFGFVVGLVLIALFSAINLPVSFEKSFLPWW